MPSVCLYFHVHQPLRVKKYKVFDVGYDHEYFNDSSNSNLNNKKVLVDKSPGNLCYSLRFRNIFPEYKILIFYKYGPDFVYSYLNLPANLRRGKNLHWTEKKVSNYYIMN